MARILIASNDESVRGPMCAQLELMGHEVHLAHDGAAAVALSLATEYDLFIAASFTRHIKALLELVLPHIADRTPSLAIVCRCCPEHTPQAIKAGSLSVLHRPWDLQDLKAAVKQALNRRTSSR